MRNKYFNPAVKSEQNLYEDLVIESLQMYGEDVYYLPRTLVNRDKIFFDDIPSKFTSAYKIEMYVDNVDGFAGEGHLFSKFGIEIRDQATFIVSKRRWNQLVAQLDNDVAGPGPGEGDLIYLPLSKSIFQIMLVEREAPFYQLSNLNVFRLECELFEYSDESMDTGIEEIDTVETLGYEYMLKLDSDSNGILPVVGDTLTQTLTSGVAITGEITAWDNVRQVVSLAHIGASDGEFHVFTPGGPSLTSTKTNATRKIRSLYKEDLGDYGWQNREFDSSVDTFMDFSENNPFGTPE